MANLKRLALAIVVVLVGVPVWFAADLIFHVNQRHHPDWFPWYHSDGANLSIENKSSHQIKIEYIKFGGDQRQFDRILEPKKDNEGYYRKYIVIVSVFDYYKPTASIEVWYTNTMTNELHKIKGVMDRSKFWMCQFGIEINDGDGKIWECYMDQTQDFD